MTITPFNPNSTGPSGFANGSSDNQSNRQSSAGKRKNSGDPDPAGNVLIKQAQTNMTKSKRRLSDREIENANNTNPLVRNFFIY